MREATATLWLHRLAWLTAIVALLPISVGAVVTTVDAGMAFADWPTSDGQGMLAYPWLKSTGDQFLEHGHRLAGMLVGVMTLILAGLAFCTDCRESVKMLVGAILLGVILQGLLGGARVLADQRLIALGHGLFAAVVFSLMGVLVAMTSSRWTQQLPITNSAATRTSLVMGAVTLIVLSVQYVLGSLLRHLGWAQAWLIHPWFALAVAIAAVGFLLTSYRTGSRTLTNAAAIVCGCVLMQAAIGLMTWGLKYGFPQWSVVAIQQSPWQVSVRSLHKVFGLMTFMTTVLAVVRTWHLLPAAQAVTPSPAYPALTKAGGLA
ncbi:hypothetical protein GC163_03930 [bacterium]|nr:hypothetical protein [bacterium]